MGDVGVDFDLQFRQVSIPQRSIPNKCLTLGFVDAAVNKIHIDITPHLLVMTAPAVIITPNGGNRRLHHTAIWLTAASTFLSAN